MKKWYQFIEGLALDQSDYRQVNFTTRQGLQSTS